MREALAVLWEADDDKAPQNRLLAAIETRDASQALTLATSMLDIHRATLSAMEKA